MDMPLLLSLLLLFIPLSSSAEIYTWKDENGVTHFSQDKPENQAAQTVEVKEQKPASQPAQNTPKEQPIETKAEKTADAETAMMDEVTPDAPKPQMNNAETLAEQDKPVPEQPQETAESLKQTDNPETVSQY